MIARTVIAVLFALAGVAPAGEGDAMLQVNDKRFTPGHAYLFKMQTPDFAGMTPKETQAGKIKWKIAPAVALSDRPFDTAALAKLESPLEALEEMAQKGAVVITATVGTKGGAVDYLRVALPGLSKRWEPDPSVATLTLAPAKGAKQSGRLQIKGDKKMHDFDPKNIPFIDADIKFEAAAPTR